MAARPLSLGKRLLFGAMVALFSVVLFFGALEGGLRLFGYGHDTRFYRVERAADGTRWFRENRDFTLTYFAPELVRRPQAFRIPEKKAPGTYRIFVLGSSAAMGDPEASFSMARTLAAMLRAAYPGRHFEVINAAITAINSTVVRAIAADCAGLEPDLFIVYEGNNEVIGPFGPAAVLAPFMRSSRAIGLTVAIKKTRTGQLLSSILHRAGKKSELKDWGGMGMFLKQQIAVDDPRLADVDALFAENLRDICASAQRSGARTLLCTVLTNQREFAPFLSRHRGGLSEDDLRAWDAAYAAGNASVAAGDTTGAEQHYRTAWKIDDQFAELAFRLGRLCLADKRNDEAKVLLQRALDCDTLRFRTDSKLNDVVRAVAARTDSAELLDLAPEIATTSPDGIIGDDALYEHVHLNFHGTWLVAQRLFAAVSADLRKRGIETPAVAAPLDYAAARERLAYTAYEQAMIIQEMLRRFSAPPFTGQSDHASRIESWREKARAADQLLHHAGVREGLSELYEHAIALSPDDWVLKRNFGMMLVALGDSKTGASELEQVMRVIPDDVDVLFALATARRNLGDGGGADATFAHLRVLEPRYPGLP